ncbi:MAG: helix-turn-helix domain-containing protein [Clostridia bacterium]|nr:helix-turn-helix domain-containing protein [Clostridia bacterium]
MIKTYVEYNSPNEMYFHHSISTSAQFTKFTRPPEVHLQCELLLLISGKVQYKIDGETYDIQPGDIILINKGEMHSIYVDLAIPFERIVFQFSPKFVPNLMDYDPLEPFVEAKTFHRIIPREYVEKSKTRNLLQAIKKACQKPDAFTDLKLISTLFSLLREINEMRKKMKKNTEKSLLPTISADKFSKHCANYINENISNSLTAKKIAQHMHVCESHLHHMFRKEMGTSVHAYILNQKMQTAALMLNEGKSPQEVAEALGYEYYSTFFNNFQNFFGYTPKEHERYQRIIVPPKITKNNVLISERIKQSLKNPPQE